MTHSKVNIIQFLKQLANVHHCIILSTHKKKKWKYNKNERINGLLWPAENCAGLMANQLLQCRILNCYVCVYISSNEKTNGGNEIKKKEKKSEYHQIASNEKKENVQTKKSALLSR